jgi:hypothetical protein
MQAGAFLAFVLVSQPVLNNKHIRSCLASRRSVSGWGHVTHGARALQPNGFRFRFIPRKVPGLSANPLGFRGGGGAAVQDKSNVKVYSSRRQESHVQRRRVTGAGAGARGCGPHHPPVSRKSPARDESSFGCVVQTRQFLFVFSLRCVGFSRSSVLKFPFKGSW